MIGKNSEKDKVACSECGISFYRWTNDKTCSPDCSKKREERIVNSEYNNSVGRDKTCVVCGADFKATSNRTVCSQECRDIRSRSYYREENNLTDTKKCARCGNEFKMSGRKKYCSEDCRVESRREYLRIQKRKQRERDRLREELEQRTNVDDGKEELGAS